MADQSLGMIIEALLLWSVTLTDGLLALRCIALHPELSTGSQEVIGFMSGCNGHSDPEGCSGDWSRTISGEAQSSLAHTFGF